MKIIANNSRFYDTELSRSITPDFELLMKELAHVAQIEQSNEADRSKEIYNLSRDKFTYEVKIESDITLEDYKKITPEKDWDLLMTWAEPMENKKVVYINPTMEGGGVAMLRPPLVHLLRLLGVDAHWYVMAGRTNPKVDESPFIFTKLMHNISQRQAGYDRITEEGINVHQTWNTENAEILVKQPTIQIADIIVLDDPQPAPLKQHIDAVNPNVKWIWRNHIDTDNKLMSDPLSPQGEVAKYLLDDCDIRNVDAVIAHPVEAFVHPGMSEKTFFAPATIEPHDDLNRTLTREEIYKGIEFINSEIAAQNTVLKKENRVEDQQEFVNINRRRIVLVARFDESKGMDKAMDLGVLTRQKMRKMGLAEHELPQIVIVGNGSIDDPSGTPMYEKMLRLRREKYPSEMKNIVLMRLKHNYQAMNALMYPTSDDARAEKAPVVAIQTSEQEGCETRISDWIKHSIPVVVSNRGGMSLQIIEGQSGMVIDYDKPGYDLDKGASYLGELLTDPAQYALIRKSTEKVANEFNNREFTTTANVTRFLRIFNSVMAGQKADRQWKISEMDSSS